MKLMHKWLLCGAVLGLHSMQPLASQITGTDLLNLLIEEQVISEDQAKPLVEKINKRPDSETPSDGITGAELLDLLLETGAISQQGHDRLMLKVERRQQAEAEAEQESAEVEGQVLGNPVRVPYIPDYLRQQMHDDIQFSVESNVVEKVKEETIRTARVYGWGIKEAPSWVHNIKLSGDVRVRFQGDMFPDDNGWAGFPDYNDINQDGVVDDQFVNIQDDRYRLRSRIRLNLKAKPFERVEVGVRLTSGSPGNPVSSNQTLGSYGEKWDANFDLGYIQYSTQSGSQTYVGGRFKNPFFHTDLVFDSDMTFEGIAGTYYFLREDSFYDDERRWDPYVTLGIFPLQEIHKFALPDAQTDDVVSDLNDKDKYLYAIQVGATHDFLNTDRLTLGLAYYKFENVKGERNPLNFDVTDVTAPPYLQVGNSLFDVANTFDNGEITYTRLGLASEFELLNANIEYKLSKFFPTFVFLHADYVKNLGFDLDEVQDLVDDESIRDRDIGWQIGVALGTQTLKYRRDWRLAFTYRHLEGDAVLDAFADSDFLLGGTDAKGYILAYDYAFFDDVVGTVKWLSADSIDTDPSNQDGSPNIFNISVDTIQFDVSARF